MTTQTHDMSDIFREEEDRLTAEYNARVASGQDQRERDAFVKRSAEENARLIAHGCIETESEDEGDDL